VRKASAGIEWVMMHPVKDGGSARGIARPVAPASIAMVSRQPTSPAASLATRF
jgi:hypothetical protein